MVSFLRVHFVVSSPVTDGIAVGEAVGAAVGLVLGDAVGFAVGRGVGFEVDHDDEDAACHDPEPENEPNEPACAVSYCAGSRASEEGLQVSRGLHRLMV